MLAKNFEDLDIWKKAREIVNLVYDDFRSNKDYRYRDQVTSAAVSIMNNIAEGHGRESKKEFFHFLNIAKSSCNEVKNLYYIAEDQKYLAQEICIHRRDLCEHEKNSIAKLMNYLKYGSKKL
jgi:four helix bundle protein